MQYIGKLAAEDNTYLGSGKHLRLAIDKYGRSNFSRETLETCTDLDQLSDRERYWIEYYDAVKSDMFYNIAIGGDGGDTFSGNPNKDQIRLRNSLAVKGRKWINNPETGKYKFILPDKLQEFLDLGWIKSNAPNSLFGSGTNMNGRLWVCNSGTKKLIEPTELNDYLLLGWKIGQNWNGSGTTGKIWIHCVDSRKMIRPDELDQYLKLGWIIGYGSRDKSVK